MLPNLRLSFFAVFFFSLIISECVAQQDSTARPKRRFREFNRTFQVSLLPGISTNGVASGDFYNKISLNIFGGTSAGSQLLEIGLLTNNNFKKSNGIQFGGLANIIGANAFVNLTLSEERTLIHDDFRCNFQGIQISGLLNYVLDHAKGIQLSGGLNHAGRDFEGVQIAGIGNSSGGTSIGFHLAGLYNMAHESVGGFQIAGLFNFTDEELAGVQIALINKARWIRGKRSSPPSTQTGFQIGLLNFSKEMHGTQIGLINFGGAMRGKQLGLINFFKRMPSKDPVYMGTPVGLINIGSYGSYFRIYYNEIFTTNAEYTTGNCINCTWTQSTMPYWDNNKKQNQNALIVGYDHWKNIWGFGYGFQKVLYKKSSMNPKDKNNELRMMTYGIRFIHLNRDTKVDKTFNMITRLNFDWGKFKWGKKYKTYYWFIGASLNYYLFDSGTETEVYTVQSVQIPAGKLFKMNAEFWPGYNVGVQL
jgi:hypothetical protein